MLALGEVDLFRQSQVFVQIRESTYVAVSAGGIADRVGSRGLECASIEHPGRSGPGIIHMIFMGLPLYDIVSAPVVENHVPEVVGVAHPECATAGVLQDPGDLPSPDPALGGATRYDLTEPKLIAKRS